MTAGQRSSVLRKAVRASRVPSPETAIRPLNAVRGPERRARGRARRRPAAGRCRRAARRARGRPGSAGPRRRRPTAPSVSTVWPALASARASASGTRSSTRTTGGGRGSRDRSPGSCDQRGASTASCGEHAVVDHVGDHLRVPLRLLVAAGRAADEPRLPVAADEVRVQRVHRPLARARCTFGWPASRLKPRPARLLSVMPVSPGDDAGAERGRQAVDERDRVAVAVRRPRSSSCRRRARPTSARRRSNAPARGSISARRRAACSLEMSVSSGHLTNAGSPAYAVAVLERELLRLDRRCMRSALVRRELAEVEAFEDVQLLEHQEPLRGRAPSRTPSSPR